MTTAQFRTIGALLVLTAIVIIGWSVLTMPDHRSTGTRIGDAIDALPEGVDKAGRQLEKRTPGERLGDAVKDTGDKISKETSSDK